MRNFLFILSLLLISVFVQATTSVTSNLFFVPIPAPKDTSVHILMFNDLKSGTVKYETAATSVEWFNSADLNTPITDGTIINNNGIVSNEISISDSTGYTLKVDGKIVTHYWIIDYKKHLPSFSKFEPSKVGPQCKSLNLLINDSTGGMTPLTYKSADLSVTYELPREFSITYQTKKWKTDAWAQEDTTINKVTLTRADKYITLDNPPLCNTTFTIKGDQYVMNFMSMGAVDYTFTSPEYIAVAVKTNLTSVLAERTERNEKERPEKIQPNQKKISGSAPLDLQFLSNANEPTVESYKWDYFMDKELIISRLDKDQRYAFNEAGNYLVKLTASNKACSCTDSLTVVTSESSLFIPRIFTPNGDGIQDEFRVGYKSIASFDCWVYNRWGRLVYHWNDPQRGWDGNINGQKAPSGAYFYVIQAVGTDKKVYKKAGDINIYRGKDE